MPSPKLGLATIVGLSHPLEGVLDIAEATGLDGVEITGRPPHLTGDPKPGELEAARQAVHARGLEALAFGSYVGFRGRFARGHVESAVAAAIALGTSRLRVWAESPTGSFDRQGFSDLVALLQLCCDEAGNRDIDVVVERHERSFADTAENVERLLDTVNRPNFALNYQPLDHLPVAACSQLPEDARRLAAHARYFHLKNYRVVNAPSPTLELAASLADGALDYARILESSLDAGYSGPLVLEFTDDDESKTLAKRVEADVDFLRQTLDGRLQPKTSKST